jgi:MoxR-like ATPase
VAENTVIRQAAEERHRVELEALKLADTFPKPEGWALSPKMAATFIMGTTGKRASANGGTPSTFKTADGREIQITPKYIGDRSTIEVAIATLASDRALLLVGEPGTAKSWLSEHLTAAISGSSRYVIQGTAGTTEDQIKYSWNYAMLLAEGPSEKALVPSPMYRAMQEGKIVRMEELTRVPSEVQDSLLSILSEKEIAVPELRMTVPARRGFSVIATANTRDRGVNDMSSALKRRFNFVELPVPEDLASETAIVEKRTHDLMADYKLEAQLPPDLVKMLVTIFQELRRGRTIDGKVKVKSPSAVLSTAEAISVLFNSTILANHFGEGAVGPKEVTRSLVGAVAKEDSRDLETLREYMETVVKGRSGKEWEQLYEARRYV